MPHRKLWRRPDILEGDFYLLPGFNFKGGDIEPHLVIGLDLDGFRRRLRGASTSGPDERESRATERNESKRKIEASFHESSFSPR